ncbi:hypothetical protein AA0481_2429 [Acetobacter orientalis NRIC 0481]|uniref:Uncharacterized protein n=1 Tax=Acetobacter orientalis TaxID=146474 RepID=A0A0D6NGN9_9PROT|nr:hypothetical protein Abor_001_062 [Acetobacter orientalis]GBR21640.1 hypothetical protein AA0481_2429 [Acetobacter orientalis NRIC 0481]GEL62135.1 hypothetical protein AOR02nite_19770 [Acetobacter orientalis]
MPVAVTPRSTAFGGGTGAATYTALDTAGQLCLYPTRAAPYCAGATTFTRATCLTNTAY